MKTTHIFYLALSLFIVSCQSDDDNPKNVPVEPGEINMMNLTVGQHAKYALLNGVCGYAEQYEYSGDTLLLEVIDVEGQMMFQESFTPTSPLYVTQPKPVRYPVAKGVNQIVIPERENSALFFFYGSDFIHTSPTHNVDLTLFECDQFIDEVPFVGDEIGFLLDFEIHDVALNNQTVVSCVPIIIDLKAFLVYSEGKLNLSYTLDSGFPGLTFRGWRLIE